MVPLAITDFATKEESEYFYVNEEYETSQICLHTLHLKSIVLICQRRVHINFTL